VALFHVLDKAWAGRFAGVDEADLSGTHAQERSKWIFIKAVAVDILGRPTGDISILGPAYQGA
jgi:hypothetical protein